MKNKWFWLAMVAVLILAKPLYAHEGEDHDEAQEAVTAQQSVVAEALPANVPLGLQGLKEMISVHPLFVHFPIGLLIMSAVFYWAGTIFKNEGLIESGRWTLYGGFLFSIGAILTGLRAENVIPHDEETHQIMELHEKIAYIILFLSAALSAWTLAAKSALPRKGRAAFLMGSLFLIALVIQQADLGGRMVYLKGAGVGKKSMLQESGHSHTHGSHDHA